MLSRARRRWQALDVSPGRFRLLAFVAVVVLIVVVVSGAFVRLTGSGLGCDNWPRCGDTPFPEQEFHALVEFGNRVVALMGIVAAITVALAARRTEGLPGRVRSLAALVAVGTVAQIPLGGLTVMVDLHPAAVMSHFLLAVLVLGVATVVLVEAHAFAGGRGDSRLPRPFGWLSLLLLPAAVTLIVTGAFVTAAGPHPGAREGVSRLGNVTDAAEIHVVANAVFGVAFAICLAVLAWHRRRTRPELVLASAVIALLAVEMGVGQYQWYNALPWGAVLVHVALAALVWCGLVALVVRLVWASGIARPSLAERPAPSARPVHSLHR